jgi:hypothetical protein
MVCSLSLLSFYIVFFQLYFLCVFSFVGFFILCILVYVFVLSLTCCMTVCQHTFRSVTFAASRRLECIRQNVWTVSHSRSFLPFNTWPVCMYVHVLDYLKLHTLYITRRRPDVIFLVNVYFCFLGAITPYWILAFILIHEGYFFLDHTHRHTTVSRTPLDEWSARRRDLYLSTHNTHDRHPYPQWDSKPRSQQASGRRPTP